MLGLRSQIVVVLQLLDLFEQHLLIEAWSYITLCREH